MRIDLPRYLLVVALILGSAIAARAQTGSQKTVSQLNTEINTLLPDNQVFAITPFAARQVTLDMSASSANTLGPNTWTSLQTFNGGVNTFHFTQGLAATSAPRSAIDSEPSLSQYPSFVYTDPLWYFAGQNISPGLIVPDGSFHNSMTINAVHQATAGNPNPTGSALAFTANQFCGGVKFSQYCTGALLEANAIYNPFGQNSGRLFGGNSQVVVDTVTALGGIVTPTEVASHEFDIFCRQVCPIKEGIRILDLSSAAGTLTDPNNSGYIRISKDVLAPGMSYGITFTSNYSSGFTDGGFPIPAGGIAIYLSAPTASLASIVDAGSLGGGCSVACFVSPANNPGFWFGAAGGGGKINSTATSGAPTLSFNNASLNSDLPIIIGANGGTAGLLQLAGSTSGAVGIRTGAAAAGTFNFNLPVTAGTANFLLTSQGGAAAAMTWTSPTITVNTVACTLGTSCTISAASSLVVGSSTVTGSCTSGFNLFNNAGTLGCQANGAGGGLTVGSTTIASGTTQQLLFDNAGTLGEITKGNNCVYATNGSGVPSCATTLPSAVVASSLTSVGTLTGGATGAGFTVAIATSTITGQLALANGGTAANLTASNGGIVYSTASAFAILSGTVTAGQCLLSGSSTAPTWGACTGASGITVGSTTVTSGTTQQILYDNAGVVGEITKGANCVYGTNGSGVPACVTTLPSSVTASSLTSVGTLTGLTSSGAVSITATGAALAIGGTNTGNVNIINVNNSGTSSNGSTASYIQAALTDAPCAAVCTVQVAAVGHATTPFGKIATDVGLTGGLFFATNIGPLRFQIAGAPAFDCGFSTASICTFTYATVTPKVTSNVLVSNGSTPAGNTGTCTSGVTVTGGATAGNWVSTSACNVGGTIIISGLPAAPTGYACDAWDITTANVVLQPTGSTANSHTWTVRTTNASANDNIRFKCIAY